LASCQKLSVPLSALRASALSFSFTTDSLAITLSPQSSSTRPPFRVPSHAEQITQNETRLIVHRRRISSHHPRRQRANPNAATLRYHLRLHQTRLRPKNSPGLAQHRPLPRRQRLRASSNKRRKARRLYGRLHHRRMATAAIWRLLSRQAL